MLVIPLCLSIGAAVIVTSAISGLFGMAGGLVLMLILGLILSVQSAMVLHGVTQFFSNGWRAVLWRDWISWRTVALYCLGALPAILVPFALAYVPEKPVMLIALGLVPYLAATLPARLALDATRPRHAIACGFAASGLQLVSGVGGPLLDVFFVRSQLDRRAVVATKAMTQAVSHLLKVAYYGALIGPAPPIGLDVYGAAIAAAIAGTTLAGPLLERMSNENFRRWTKTIVLVIGAISIGQGVVLLAAH